MQYCICFLVPRIQHVGRYAYVNQTINQRSSHKATHGQGEATFQHHHRGQQTLGHEVMQAWGAVKESQQHTACATHSFSTPFTVACNATVGRNTSSGVGLTLVCLRVEFAERKTNYHIVFRLILCCEYLNLAYVRVHAIYRVS